MVLRPSDDGGSWANKEMMIKCAGELGPVLYGLLGLLYEPVCVQVT